MTIAALIWIVIYLVFACLVVAVLLWAVDFCVRQSVLPARLGQILKVGIVVIAVLIVLAWLIGYLPGPPPVMLE